MLSSPLKPLTVLVGPNASGKSNVLRALRRVKSLVNAEELPSARLIQDSLWAGGGKPDHSPVKHQSGKNYNFIRTRA